MQTKVVSRENRFRQVSPVMDEMYNSNNSLSCLISVNDFKSDVTVPVVDEGGLKRSESYENFLHSGGVTIDGE